MKPEAIYTTPTALEACPFCCGEANLELQPMLDTWFVECGKCSTASDLYRLREDAIRLWNTRATPKAPEELIAAIEKVQTYSLSVVLPDKLFFDREEVLEIIRQHYKEQK
jgi:hypothetical protein